MALLPSTAETRMVPVAGRQFAERRKIRGVGAAERAVGNAWGRLTSRQREYYGNQRNFAGGLQREATRRAGKREEDEDTAQREQGRRDAMETAPPAAERTPPANHSTSLVQRAIQSRRNRDYVAKQVEDDMYPEGKPRPKLASEQLSDAVKSGRVRDATHPASEYGKHHGDKSATEVANRGYDMAQWTRDSQETNDIKLKPVWEQAAKDYQRFSQRRFSQRRQLPKPGSYYGRQY